MSAPFRITPTVSQSIDVRRNTREQSYRIIYPQRHSKNRMARSIPRSSESSDEADVQTEQVPKQLQASLSMSVPSTTISGAIKTFSGDFPKLPYNLVLTNCLGEVYGDRICYTLQLNSRHLFCPFDYIQSEANQIILTIDPPKVSLQFELNQNNLFYHGKELDITQYLKNGENQLVFNTMSVSVPNLVASVQWRMSSNYDFFLNEIKTKNPHMSLPLNSQYITALDPTTHERIRDPGRGKDCSHAQCFDLLSFLKKAKEHDDWHCPVCGMVLSISTLRYDPKFLMNCYIQNEMSADFDLESDI